MKCIGWWKIFECEFWIFFIDGFFFKIRIYVYILIRCMCRVEMMLLNKLLDFFVKILCCCWKILFR